jgi:hypothetical protein
VAERGGIAGAGDAVREGGFAELAVASVCNACGGPLGVEGDGSTDSGSGTVLGAARVLASEFDETTAVVSMGSASCSAGVKKAGVSAAGGDAGAGAAGPLRTMGFSSTGVSAADEVMCVSRCLLLAGTGGGAGDAGVLPGPGDAPAPGAVRARGGRGGVDGAFGSSFSGVRGPPPGVPDVALRARSTPAVSAPAAMPQKPPIFDLRAGSGGFSEGLSPAVAAPTPGSAVGNAARTAPTVLCLAGGAGGGAGASSSHTRSTRAVRTNAHSEHVVRRRARHQPDAQSGYGALFAAVPPEPAAGAAVTRKTKTVVGFGRSW